MPAFSEGGGMFKNLKLAAKIALGFGAVIVVALVLGLAGWFGITSMSKNVELSKAGEECLNLANKTGLLRREFAISGFEPAAGQTKNAAEQWADTYAELVGEIKELHQRRGLKGEYRRGLNGALSAAGEYKDAFEQQKLSQKTMDESFAEWGRIGWEITGEIEKVLANTIEPAQQRAQQSKNIAEIVRWTAISEKLDRGFVEPFLLLRVNGVYLVTTKKDAQWESFCKQLKKVKAGLAQWMALARGNAELERVAAGLQSNIEQYDAAGDRFYEGVLLRRKADKAMASTAATLMNAITEVEQGLARDMDAITARTNTLITAMTIIGILLGVALAIIITRSIVGPINKIIAGLRDGSEQVASASEQLSGSSQQMSEGASEQASSLEEVSSSLEEMSSMTKQNADNSQQVNGLMAETKSLVDKGQNSMSTLAGAINEIKDSSDSTARIIKTIDEIAMQTNLLALNAAVEAARAGEAGRGFAVVAEEVRNLAQRSAEAAKNTAQLIEESQLNSEKGVNLAQDTKTAITAIAESSGKVANLVSEIAAASNEQAQGIDQINTAVAQMDQVTQTNAANAEESASASEELSSQAQSLNAMIEQLVNLVGSSRAENRLHAVRHSSARFRPVSNAAAKHTAEQSPRIERKGAVERRKPGGQAQAFSAASSARTASPEEVIPFNDNSDLDDF